MDKIGIGLLGEKIAFKLLSKKGYTILQKNYKTTFGEIDLIALENNNLVFIEVKTRTGLDFGQPYESVSKRKLHQIQKAGQIYSLKNPKLPKSLRIDVVSILLSPSFEVSTFEILKNANG
jgi:putative endonuclease